MEVASMVAALFEIQSQELAGIHNAKPKAGTCTHMQKTSTV